MKFSSDSFYAHVTDDKAHVYCGCCDRHVCTVQLWDWPKVPEDFPMGLKPEYEDELLDLSDIVRGYMEARF